MRYAISFTPSLSDPLAVAAAAWLGRNIYSGEACEQPSFVNLSQQTIAFHTAVPRRYGFQAAIKPPFRLCDGRTEADLLKAMMTFAGKIAPFEVPRMEIARLGYFYGLSPTRPSDEMIHFAASVVQTFEPFRAAVSEAEFGRYDTDGLTAAQFANLYRFGAAHVMDEFRFHMPLTGAVGTELQACFNAALRGIFEPLLEEPLKIASVALFVEQEPGAPLRIHSQHPLGKLPLHRPQTPRRSPDGALLGERPAMVMERQAARSVRQLRSGG